MVANQLYKLMLCLGLVSGLAGAALAAQVDRPVIHLRQIDYAPADAKHAIIMTVTASAAPLQWQVTDAAGTVVLRGVGRPRGTDAASGDAIQDIDFSAIHRVGRYRLAVDGADLREFGLADAPFARLKYAALNYFYQTRAGIAIDARYAGGAQWARPAGHPHEIAGCFAGQDMRGNVWPGCATTRDVTGGWYDAGDQGKYVVNGGIALWTLQNLYEQQRQWGDRSFADGRAALPESGNGIDDLLDESRWEMQFLLAMQIPDGQSATVAIGPQEPGQPLLLTRIDASGMVHHKVADREWTTLPTAPADDTQPRVLYPPSTAATLNLAATAAQCARIWRIVDPVFADRCLTAAERAFAAAQRNPAIFAPHTFTGSGDYGDTDLADEFFWAAAELYVTTGRADLAALLRSMPAFRAAVTVPGWANVATLGTITLATEPNGLTTAERSYLRAAIVTAADELLVQAGQSGYRIPHRSAAFVWGSNGDMLNRAMVLGLAERLTGQHRYRDGVVDVADYLLGRNPLDQSYVSGFGTRPMVNPHHRFWAHGLDPRYPGPPPGVLSGGPNSTAMDDPVARTMQGHCTGLRCWRDANAAFTMNEVAINWNAPLVWVAAYLDAPETR